VDADLSGRTVVVTGASSGIGEAAARALHHLGAEVHVVGRSPERTGAIAAEVGTEPILADFAHLDALRAAAKEILDRCPHLDVLVNNAGLVVSRRTETDDGHEMTFQVNHLAPFLLTNLLLDRLTDSAPSRVITTASIANGWGFVRLNDLETRHLYQGAAVYGTTKLENILFTRELGRRLEGSGVLATCFNPGFVATRLGRQDSASGFIERSPMRRFMRTPEQGADTLVWLATAPADRLKQGAYYSSRRVTPHHPQGYSDRVARRLWERSEELVGSR
jgi:NAD(P)-dependent dehydrogenase (short-subunit alcohol dehydrogenase family)